MFIQITAPDVFGIEIPSIMALGILTIVLVYYRQKMKFYASQIDDIHESLTFDENDDINKSEEDNEETDNNEDTSLIRAAVPSIGQFFGTKKKSDTHTKQKLKYLKSSAGISIINTTYAGNEVEFDKKVDTIYRILPGEEKEDIDLDEDLSNDEKIKTKINHLEKLVASGNIVYCENPDDVYAVQGTRDIVETLYDKVVPEGKQVEGVSYEDMIIAVHEFIQSKNVVIKENGSNTVEAQIEGLYSQYTENNSDLTPKSQLREIEKVFDDHVELVESIGDMYDKLGSGEAEGPFDQLSEIGFIAGDSANYPEQINRICENINGFDKSTNATENLQNMEEKVEAYFEYTELLDDCIERIDDECNRIELNTQVDSDTQDLKELFQKLKRKSTFSPHNAQDLAARLAEYDEFNSQITEIQKRPNESYSADEINEMCNGLNDPSGNQFLDNIYPIIYDYRDVIQKNSKLKKQKQDLQQDKQNAKRLIENIREHLDMDDFVVSFQHSGIGWLEPLEKLNGAIQEDKIGTRTVNNALSQIELSDDAPRELVDFKRMLNHPDMTNQARIQTRLNNHFEYVIELEQQITNHKSTIATAKKHVDILDNNVEYGRDESGLGRTDRDWIDILKQLATSASEDEIGRRHVANSAKKIKAEFSDEDSLVATLADTSIQDTERLKKELRVAQQHINEHKSITNSNASNVDSNMIRNNIDRLRSNIPESNMQPIYEVLDRHLDTRENDLDNLDENDILKRYGIYQEIVGIEDLIADLDASIDSNEVEEYKRNIEERLELLKDTKQNENRFAPANDLIKPYIAMSERFFEDGAEALNQNALDTAHAKFEAADIVIDNGQDMFNGNKKKLLAKAAGIA